MLEKLYSIGWKGKTKLVKLPKTKKKEDDDTEKPEPEDDDVYLEVDEAIQKKISITKQRVSSSDFWNKIEKCNGNYQKELDVLFS